MKKVKSKKEYDKGCGEKPRPYNINRSRVELLKILEPVLWEYEKKKSTSPAEKKEVLDEAIKEVEDFRSHHDPDDLYMRLMELLQDEIKSLR
jgi:hypothetical protein